MCRTCSICKCPRSFACTALLDFWNKFGSLTEERFFNSYTHILHLTLFLSFIFLSFFLPLSVSTSLRLSLLLSLFLFIFHALSYFTLTHSHSLNSLTHTHTHTHNLSLSLSLFLSLSFLKTSKITLNPSISSYNIFCYPLRSFCPSSLSFHLSFVNSLQKLSLKIHTQTLSIIHTKDKHTHTQTCIMVEYANICLDVDPFNKIVWENKT